MILFWFRVSFCLPNIYQILFSICWMLNDQSVILLWGVLVFSGRKMVDKLFKSFNMPITIQQLVWNVWKMLIHWWIILVWLRIGKLFEILFTILLSKYRSIVLFSARTTVIAQIIQLEVLFDPNHRHTNQKMFITMELTSDNSHPMMARLTKQKFYSARRSKKINSWFWNHVNAQRGIIKDNSYHPRQFLHQLNTHSQHQYHIVLT